MKNQSLLIQSVTLLDSYFAELSRLGSKIENMDIKNDSDYDLLQRLLNRFSENGQNLSQEIVTLSENLSEMRVRAEAVTKLVAEKAQKLQERKDEKQKKMDEFRILSEKVRELALSINDLKSNEEPVTPDDRTRIAVRLAEFEVKLHPLIEEAKHLKLVAHEAKMKALEQSADSLGQTLQAISAKTLAFTQSSSVVQ